MPTRLTRRETYFLLVGSFLAGLILSGGCGPLQMPGAPGVPSELVPFQGTWKLDQLPSTPAEGEADETARAEEREIIQVLQQFGVAMGDIEIRGQQIRQVSGLLQSQYDLLDYRSVGGRIVGTALWHEDRHDPGDATEVEITLERDGDTLILTRGEDGEAERFRFQRSAG